MLARGGEADALTDVFPLSNAVNSIFPFNLRLGYSVIAGQGMDASDISFVQNGLDVDMTLTFRPSVEFAAFMNDLNEDERQYCIWVSVGDQAPETNKSDRVSLLLDFNSLVTFVEPIGAFPGLTIDFLNHPQDSTDTPVACGNNVFVEDDLLAKVSFQIDTDTGPTIPIPTAMTFGVLMENTITGQQYKLDTSEVDLTVFPDPTQFNFDESRGFKLGVDNTKNWWKVDHDPTNDSGLLKGVLGWYGFKIRWEDWIAKFPTAPNDFYDNTLGKNGLANDWYDYYNTPDWDFFFYVELTTQLGTYQNLKRMVINDYDTNSTITTVQKFYRDNNGVKGALLTAGIDPVFGGNLGVIIPDEIVWVDIEYTSSVDIADWTNQA